MSNEIEEFFSGGGKAFAFDAIGDTVTGEILDMVKRQQTSLTTGEKLFWDNGDPRMMLVITLQTDESSDDDDGIRTVFVRGGRYEIANGKGSSMKDAIAEALRGEGLKAPRVGDKLAVCYTGESKARKGYSPAKLYTAGYQKAVAQEASGFFDD